MNKHSVCKALKLIVILLCAAGVGFFALWRFPNRGLTAALLDSQGRVLGRASWTAEQIAGEEGLFAIPLRFDAFEKAGGSFAAAASTLRVSGVFKSISAKEFDFNAISRMIGGAESCEWKWTPKCVEVKGLAILFIMINVFEERLSDTARNNHSFVFEVKKFFSQLRRYKNYMVYSARADLNAEVANSYLNRLWWLLEPFFNMMVYVVIFGRVMGNSVQNYATFVFSALLMWNYFSKILNFSVKLVRNSRDIVTKVYVPKFVLLLSNMFLNFFKLIFSMSVLIVMLAVFRVHVGFNVVWILPAYALMILLSFGAGMVLLHYGVFIDDLAYAIGILLNMLMFLSGVFYNVMTTLPEPLNVLMMTVNPVALFIDVMRNALLLNRAADLPLLGLWLFVSLLLCYAGVHIVYKNENSYVKII